MLKILSLLHAFIICGTVSYASATIIHSDRELEKAASAAKPGDQIVIANGNYSGWEADIKAHGLAGKPVVIKAETSGGVVFSGSVPKAILKVSGSYIEISGFTFNGCQIEKGGGSTGQLINIHDSDHCRLTDCTFTKNEVKAQFMPIVVISGNSEANRVDHCRFISNINNQELQVKIAAEAVPQHTLIDHNEFRDKAKVTWLVFNGGECVQVGQDPVMLGTRKAYTTVRDNRFIHCDGEPEVISNKSSENQYIHNYLEDCQGELVMRGGHDCVIDSNTIKGGAGGIRVNGSHHIITHNIISGTLTGIRLMYGMAKGKDEIGFYIAATDCKITGNQISNTQTGILIGDSKNLDWTGKFDTKKYPSRTTQDVPPANNIIENNTITATEVLVKHNEQ